MEAARAAAAAAADEGARLRAALEDGAALERRLAAERVRAHMHILPGMARAHAGLRCCMRAPTSRRSLVILCVVQCALASREKLGLVCRCE